MTKAITTSAVQNIRDALARPKRKRGRTKGAPPKTQLPKANPGLKR
jgi:hypothetical protein